MMSVRKLRIVALMIYVMGGFSTVLAQKRYRRKQVAPLSIQEQAAYEQCPYQDVQGVVGEQCSYSCSSGQGQPVDAQGQESQTVIIMENPYPHEELGHQVAVVENQGQEVVYPESCTQCVQYGNVQNPDVESMMEMEPRNSRRVKTRRSRKGKRGGVYTLPLPEQQIDKKHGHHGRVQKYKTEQLKQKDLQLLVRELQDILLINPAQMDDIGFVRSALDNQHLALQLFDIASILLDAGFNLNMAYVHAKIDEFNERPGTANAVARDYARQVDHWKKEHEHIAYELQECSMTISQQNRQMHMVQEHLKHANELILDLQNKLEEAQLKQNMVEQEIVASKKAHVQEQKDKLAEEADKLQEEKDKLAEKAEEQAAQEQATQEQAAAQAQVAQEQVAQALANQEQETQEQAAAQASAVTPDLPAAETGVGAVGETESASTGLESTLQQEEVTSPEGEAVVEASAETSSVPVVTPVESTEASPVTPVESTETSVAMPEELVTSTEASASQQVPTTQTTAEATETLTATPSESTTSATPQVTGELIAPVGAAEDSQGAPVTPQTGSEVSTEALAVPAVLSQAGAVAPAEGAPQNAAASQPVPAPVKDESIPEWHEK